MTRLAAILSLLIASAVLTGCLPDSPANVDEQKDAHYLSGRNKVSSLDYNGAIQDFEKALENNPHSASAHFELALLYENQMKDYAAAIYHYERHLKFRPLHHQQSRSLSQSNLARSASPCRITFPPPGDVCCDVDRDWIRTDLTSAV